MNQIENVSSIYNGDLEKLKKVISKKDDIRIYNISSLMNAQKGEEYRIGLIPLILKAEAEHPGQFFKYKSLDDFVSQKEGVNYVVFGWKNPSFFKYTKTNQLVNLTVPVSKQMTTYLRHLEVRAIELRKKKADLLKQLDEETKLSDPVVKQAVQVVKRQIVKNYRLLNSKSKKR